MFFNYIQISLITLKICFDCYILREILMAGVWFVSSISIRAFSNFLSNFEGSFLAFNVVIYYFCILLVYEFSNSYVNAPILIQISQLLIQLYLQRRPVSLVLCPHTTIIYLSIYGFLLRKVIIFHYVL